MLTVNLEKIKNFLKYWLVKIALVVKKNANNTFAYINNKIKTIKLWKAIIAFLPPIVFAWPLFCAFTPYPLNSYLAAQAPKQAIDISIPSSSTTIQGNSDSMGSKNLLSLLFRVKTASMPIELCLYNQNRIFNGDNKEITPEVLSDVEVGAMNIKYHNKNDNSPYEIYSKIGDTNCSVLPTDGVVLDESEIRNPLPVEPHISLQRKNILIELKQNKSVVKVFEHSAYYHIQWQTSVFLIDLLIFAFAWWVLLSSFLSVWKWIH